MKPEQTPPRTGTVVHALGMLVSFICRHPLPVLLLGFALATASALAFCAKIEYFTKRSDLIGQRKDALQRWRGYVAEFGDDDDIVVVVAGNDRRRMELAIETLANQVRAYPDLFDRLFYTVDLRQLRERSLLFLSSGQIGQIQANLKSMGLLLDFGPISWQSLTLLSLLQEARARAGRLSPGSELSSADEQFMRQLLAIVQSASATLANPADYFTPWQSLLGQPRREEDLLAKPQYFFSGDGSLAFLLARPIQEQGSFTAARRNVDVMRAIVAGVRQQYPDLELGLTGLPVLETDEMVASQEDTQVASVLALVGVGLLYLLVFRGPRYPLLTVATLLVGTAWAMGWLTLTVGHLNILSATFAMMLIGMGDYGVLWVTRYEQDRVAGADVSSAMRATAAAVGPGILTAAVTTALAFYAAMLADFQAVAELGWIAGSGVLLCALACFTVMPALLCLFDRRRQPIGRCAPLQARAVWLPWLGERPRWVIGAGVVLTASLAFAACRLGYDHNLLHLHARGLDSVEWELKLIEHTAGASWHALSYTSSQEEALARKARFERLDGVNRVVEVASLVPQDQGEKLRQLQDIQSRLRRLPERGRLLPPVPPQLAEVRDELTSLIGQLERLAEASSQPLLPDLGRSLTTLHERIAGPPPDRSAPLWQGFQQRLASDLAEDLHRLRDVSHPEAITKADLPEELRERYIGKNGNWLLRVFGKDCLWEYEPLAQFVEQIQTVDPGATGKPFTTLEGLRAMQRGYLWAAVYALVAVVLVLLIDFRDLRHTAAALAPLAMGVILTLGLMGLLSVPLNPANMIAFPLILGVGVDNGVHVLHDYLARKRDGQPYALGHAAGQGIFVAALTTVLGFGSLMVSQHQGLVGLGLVLSLGVSCCMVSALVFLPAVLRLMSQDRRNMMREGVLPTGRRAA